MTVATLKTPEQNLNVGPRVRALREAMDLAQAYGLQRVLLDAHPDLGEWIRQLAGTVPDAPVVRSVPAKPQERGLPKPATGRGAVLTAKEREVLDLLARLRRQHGLAWLFISHDLSVVRAITDRVLVMDRGRIVEEGPTARVLAQPQHAVTQRLVEAAPVIPEEWGGLPLHRDTAPLPVTGNNTGAADEMSG